jgi:hypothetical protein
MLIAGVVLLVIAVAALFWARSERAGARKATATETLACGDISSLSTGVADEVGGGSFTQRCEVVGAAQPGPSGALKAPESGADAVWARTTVTHKYGVMEEQTTDGRTTRTRKEREEQVSSVDTDTPFAVKDDSGTVLVHPSGADIDEPEQVADRFERADVADSIGDSVLSALFRSGNDSGTIGFEHEEWIIRPGTRLYVQGEVADRTGGLVFSEPKDDGPFLISTRSEEEIVSGKLRNAKIATAVGVVAALAGVALLIAGALA